MYKYNLVGTYLHYQNDSLLNHKEELLKAGDYFNELSTNAKTSKQMKIKKITNVNIYIELVSECQTSMPSRALRVFCTLCTKFLEKKNGTFKFNYQEINDESYETSKNINMQINKESNLSQARSILLSTGLKNVELAEILECTPAYISKIMVREDHNVSDRFLSLVKSKFGDNSERNKIHNYIDSLNDEEIRLLIKMFKL